MRAVRKIIVGIRDLKARRLPALEKAAQLASAWKAEIEVFHAIPLDPQATKILEMRAKQHAQARLRPLLKHATIARSSRHLISEHPINGIPRLARNIDSDLVVMGALSRTGLKRMFIGNTAERMLDELACDVLVVKPPGFRSSLVATKRAA